MVCPCADKIEIPSVYFESLQGVLSSVWTLNDQFRLAYGKKFLDYLIIISADNKNWSALGNIFKCLMIWIFLTANKMQEETSNSFGMCFKVQAFNSILTPFTGNNTISFLNRKETS